MAQNDINNGMANLDINPDQGQNVPPIQPQVPGNSAPPQAQAQDLVVDQLKLITHELSSQGVHNLIQSFDGTNPKCFRSWIKDVTKYGVLVNADDDRLKRLYFGTAKGVVSSFIERFLRANPNAPSRELIKELQLRFSDVADEQSALILFRKMCQGKSESIQSFYERVVDIAEQAFVGANLHEAAYQSQLVMCFCDGIRDNRIARHVVRSRPRNLSDALKAAIAELQLLKQLDARGKLDFSPPRTSNRIEEPMEIGVTNMVRQNASHPPFQGSCYSCGKRGHKARQCLMNMHHPSRANYPPPLNYHRPPNHSRSEHARNPPPSPYRQDREFHNRPGHNFASQSYDSRRPTRPRYNDVRGNQRQNLN